MIYLNDILCGFVIKKMLYNLDFTDSFEDHRLNSRAAMVFDNMINSQTTIVRTCSKTESAYRSALRFYNNPKVGWEDVVSCMYEGTYQNCQRHHILVFQDSTEINYQSHYNFLDTSCPDLGPVGNDRDIGFFMHAGLAIDIQLGIPIGFSYAKLWNRSYNKLNMKARNYKHQPIEEKESYRWIDCALQSKEVLKNASCITIVGDRESDIYQEFSKVPDNRTHLLVRSRKDRKLADDSLSLYQKLDSQKKAHKYLITVRATKKRPARKSKLEVKYCEVKIKRPRLYYPQQLPPFIPLYAIEVKECNSKIPERERISWKLITTHEVLTKDDAVKIIQWYAMRWQIEIIFGILKSKGLNIEQCQMESGKALKVNAAMAMQTSLKIQQLRLATDGKESLKATLVFDQIDIPLLEIVNSSVEGKTAKQKNPHQAHSLAWASWIIARVGGWLGGKDKPGIKTYSKGLEKFEVMANTYKLLNQKMCT
jgi:hypothetical protein